MQNEMIINNVTELIGHTPLIRLNKVTQGANMPEILGKLESQNPGGSIKDRVCLFMINDAITQGLIDENTTIIEPTSGNTGIGLAMICAVKGLNCILTMPDDLSLERIYLLRSYGAEVVLTPAKHGLEGSIKKAEELHQKINNSFIPRQFRSLSNPRAHQETTAPEIYTACAGRCDVFVAGVGTGGTITGIGEYLKERLPDVKVFAVEPEHSAVLSGEPAGRHKLQGIGAGFIPEILNRDILDGVIKVSDRDAFDMARRLSREEGLCVGITAGANVYAALQLAKDMKANQRIVTILCDTGERYFTVEQYFEA